MELNISELFTAQSLLTLQVGAAACYVVPNVLAKVFPIPDRGRALISLLLALLLQLLAASQVDGGGLMKWVTAVFNGFLVAASALGINQLATTPKETARERDLAERSPASPARAAQRRFVQTWL